MKGRRSIEDPDRACALRRCFGYGSGVLRTRLTCSARTASLLSIGALAHLLSACAPFVGVPPDGPAQARIAALRSDALKGTGALALARSLTTEVGPRPAGSDADRAAIAWAVRTMRALGLQRVRTEPVRVRRWLRGESSAELVSHGGRALSIAALGGSVATPAEGLTAEVIAVTNLAALQKLPDSAIAGRIVFFHERMRRAKDGAGYGETVGIRSRGPRAAGKKGARAVVIRSVGTGSHGHPHTGGTWYRDGIPKIPAAALSQGDADALLGLLAQGPVRLRLTLTPRDGGDVETANVIGEVVGSEAPDEIVLLGAHLDSWDLGPGALDDAAGCAIVLEAARRIAALPERPKRTVRVVLFASEETGIVGAKAYGVAHAGELGGHVLATEADFGTGRVYALRTRVAERAMPLVGTLLGLLAPLGISRGANTATGGADLRPLFSAGVPVVTLAQDGTHYFDVHHTAADTVAALDGPALDQAVAAFGALALFAAETRARFGPISPR